MAESPPRNKRLLVAVLAVICLCVLAPVGLFVFQAIAVSNNAGVGIQFDQTVDERAAEISTIDVNLTIDELEECLTSFQTGSAVTTIGEYELDSTAEQTLNTAIASFTETGNDVSFVMIDLTSGYGVSYNADTEFYSASTIKGPYVAALAESVPHSIQSSRASMVATIEQSSNTDYFALRSTYGRGALGSWLTDAGFDISAMHDGFPYYSSRVLAKLWLYTYRYFESEDATTVRSWYESPRNSSIHSTLGELYTIRCKAGWIAEPQNAATSDAGIVYADNSPYLLVIQSDVPSNMGRLDDLVLALDAIHGSMEPLISVTVEYAD